mmetsp:Transcript_19857/g.28545  ORF Transcript_19857/g.28545 Transcript_19857/m.28545 type:complete len:481 (+) Transcript_19857:89-1531(+)|eukprot:CAMPEP_0185028206 /NCGR_PEP_ID=MMETSP1103-20130426/13838_1 /TAXON_ID=36769 /ORGANISM="Paraphysomonas bandaiensis, Strain Caron Lab Isolate" /LENGTH=480 /DNA_ID=CAMNT_0027562551 /DNA_START=87 /DNA_END=1529 /DNA_ORIENTATION=-
MKVKVNITCGSDKKSIYVSCGRGDKSLKWLGMVASQQYALACPNGALRRRDSDNPRGSSYRVQQLPHELSFADGESPHPGSLICDYMNDGDEINCVLGTQLPVDFSGTSIATKWATTAFTSSYDYVQDSDEKEHEGASMEEVMEQQSQAQFMKVILGSQLYDYKQLRSKLYSAWESVPRIMPRLSEKHSEELCLCVSDHVIILFDLFDHFSENGSMDFTAYKAFIDDSEFFAARDVSRQVSRVYRRTIKNSDVSTIDLGGFLASLIFCAQLRHNDTLDEYTALNDCCSALSCLLKSRLPPLARKLNLDCLVRMELCDEYNLYQMRQYHNDVFVVFEYYSTKMQRDLPTTITLEYATEAINNGGLLDEPDDVALVSRLADNARSGMIAGREHLNYAKGVTNDLPQDELTFAEFFETVMRAGLVQYVGKQVQPESEEEDIDTRALYTTSEAMLKGLRDVGKGFHNPMPRKVQVTTGHGRDRK